jgi:hypothetical protein
LTFGTRKKQEVVGKVKRGSGVLGHKLREFAFGHVDRILPFEFDQGKYGGLRRANVVRKKPQSDVSLTFSPAYRCQVRNMKD